MSNDNTASTLLSANQSTLLAFLLLAFLIPAHIHAATTPGWSWAKGIGGDCQDQIFGISGKMYHATHLDSADNIYELFTSQSSSVSVGSVTYSNPMHATPSSGGRPISIFVKYGPTGNVIWSQNLKYNSPVSMHTTPEGLTYFFFPFVDSIRLGSRLLIDTSINFYHPGYCLAKYDPSGSIVSLHAYKTDALWLRAFEWKDGNILAMGLSGRDDSINGHAFKTGTFLAVMDTAGRVTFTKSLGFDTSNVQICSANQITCNKHSVSFCVTTPARSVFYQNAVPVNLALYPKKTVVIRLDSNLNFQWSLPCSNNMGRNVLETDESSNIYMDGQTISSIYGDTFQVGNSITSMPFKSPSGHFEYIAIAKIDPAGVPLWIDTFLNTIQYTGGFYGVSADFFGNIYAYGLFSAALDLHSLTLMGGDAFVAKLSPDGQVKWAQAAKGRLSLGGISADRVGNVFVNGSYGYSTVVNTFFGNDTLICHTPIANYPIAADVFTAKIGNCVRRSASITAQSPTVWCGRDSVLLRAPQGGQQYLWQNGDTGRIISASATGNYSVIISDSNGCFSGPASISVTAHENPAFEADLAGQIRCHGDSSASISIHGPSGLNIISTPPLADLLHVRAGLYYLTATDTFGCRSQDTISVEEPLALQVEVDTMGALAVANASGGTGTYSFHWSSLAGGDSITMTSPGWYVVSVSDSNFCQAKDSVFYAGPNGLADLSMDLMSIFPSPATEAVCVTSAMAANLAVYSMEGKLMIAKALGAGSNYLDMQSWPSGSYSFVVQNAHLSSVKVVQKVK